MKGLVIGIFIILIIVGIGYYTYSDGVSSVLSSISFSPSPVSNCTASVNQVIKTIVAKTPPGTNVTIVNTDIFPYSSNGSMVLREVTIWSKQWSSYYIDTGSLPSYIIHDAGYVGAFAVSHNITKEAGIGEAIRVSLSPQYVNTRFSAGTAIYPLLCNSLGQIESGSANITNQT